MDNNTEVIRFAQQVVTISSRPRLWEVEQAASFETFRVPAGKATLEFEGWTTTTVTDPVKIPVAKILPSGKPSKAYCNKRMVYMVQVNCNTIFYVEDCSGRTRVYTQPSGALFEIKNALWAPAEDANLAAWSKKWVANVVAARARASQRVTERKTELLNKAKAAAAGICVKVGNPGCIDSCDHCGLNFYHRVCSVANMASARYTQRYEQETNQRTIKNRLASEECSWLPRNVVRELTKFESIEVFNEVISAIKNVEPYSKPYNVKQPFRNRGYYTGKAVHVNAEANAELNQRCQGFNDPLCLTATEITVEKGTSSIRFGSYNYDCTD